MTPEQVSDALKLADFALNSEGSNQREIELARLALHLAAEVERLRVWLARAPQANLECIADEVGAFAIEVEKLLCTKLGREWSAAGISIKSLVEELVAAREQAEARLAKAREALEQARAWIWTEASHNVGPMHPTDLQLIANIDAAIKGAP